MSDPARAKPILGYGDPLGVQADDTAAFEVHSDEADDSRADLVFLECGRGGVVFPSSTITWALGLAAKGYANDVFPVSENRLQGFLDPAPFGRRPARDAGGAS